MRFLTLLGAAERQRNFAVTLAVVSSLSTLILAAGFVARSLTSPITPYVISVDTLGNATALGPADAYKAVDEVVITADLRRFIANLRLVTADATIQAKALDHVYAYVPTGSEAYHTISAELTAHNPRTLSASISRTTEQENALRLANSKSTYRLRWVERTLDMAGTPTLASWEAFATIELEPPTSLETINRNPLGLYIKALSFTRLSGETK